MNRRLLSTLTVSDLKDNPVWEHWIEKDIEFVQSTNKIEINDSDNKVFIVLTSFTLRNGNKLSGFCSPQDNSGLDYIQPTIFTDKGQVIFWNDMGWTNESIDREIGKFGIDKQYLFPILYRTLVKFNGEFYEGTIEDFNRGK